MTGPASILPEYLAEQYSQLCTYLSPGRVRDLEEYFEQFSETKKLFDSLPTKTVLFEIYKISPDKLKLAFENALVALAHACEALLGFWSFQHSYKFKASLNGFEYAPRPSLR